MLNAEVAIQLAGCFLGRTVNQPSREVDDKDFRRSGRIQLDGLFVDESRASPAEKLVVESSLAASYLNPHVPSATEHMRYTIARLEGSGVESECPKDPIVVRR